MNATNEDKHNERNRLRKAIKAHDARRLELEAQRERDPHSIDYQSFRDHSMAGQWLVTNLVAAGGNPRRLDETT